MEQQKQRYDKFFISLSTASALFVLTEIILQFFGKSICPTEGCKIVSGHVRYGDLSILIIGLATFSFLTLLAGMDLASTKTGRGRVMNAVLIISLASEGFFTGYQAFGVKTPCLFCLIIFSLVIMLSILRLAAGEKDLIAGFLAFAAVFGMAYLVPPATTMISLPQSERLILFYSKECKHCAEVIKDIDDKKLAVTHLDVNEYAGFLKSMGIEHVPTLLVNDPYQKVFLTGKDPIERYLLACTEAKNPEKKVGPAKSAGAKTVLPVPDSGGTVDIFSQSGLLTSPAPTTEEGMCKEDEICK